MSGYDRGEVYSHASFPGEVSQATTNHAAFLKFIRDYRVDNNFIYRDQLRQNVNMRQLTLNIHMFDLISFDQKLAAALMARPAEYLPQLESAVAEAAKQVQRTQPAEIDERAQTFQVTLSSDGNLTPIRNLTSEHISKLVRVPGIIIAANTVQAKATRIHIICRQCGNALNLALKTGLTGVQLPRTCPGPATEVAQGVRCPIDPYIISPDQSLYVDQQTLKLQEAPDQVPVGELPRSMLVTVDRNLANRAVPGTRVTLVGIYSIFQSTRSGKANQSAVAVRSPYLRVIGMETDAEGAGRGGKRSFTPTEEAAMLELSRMPDIYERFARSIAPSIFGFDDVKKAVACLLFGGSRKILQDGLRLRGDCNVLLLGDPGTAKSQMLKFVEKVAPIGVYTSGKGSSAAGLTASVVREPGTREFYLEGGAMVLADGGVVCIDEFDKMREEDRVAIHEAMEQQTISIAKAGITTILNSRTSVLAAANPVFGRYDDLKTPGENIDFQTTILSRFDMIFLVRDEHNEVNDARLARHVMGVHMNASVPEMAGGDLDVQTMKNYISFAKSRCGPRLSPAAAEKLSNHFVTIRSDIRSKEVDQDERSTIPITVRQLEAIVRISESLAKMSLAPFTTEQHVDEAIRLFRVSTMAAVDSGQVIEGLVRKEFMQEVDTLEGLIRRKMPIGTMVSEKRLMDEFLAQGFSKYAIEKTVALMLKKDDLSHRNQGRHVVRIR